MYIPLCATSHRGRLRPQAEEKIIGGNAYILARVRPQHANVSRKGTSSYSLSRASGHARVRIYCLREARPRCLLGVAPRTVDDQARFGVYKSLTEVLTW